jgi:hypothetical protein
MNEGIEEETSSWSNYGHLLGGFNESDGIVLASEGLSIKGFTYSINKDNEYIVSKEAIPDPREENP